MVTRITSLPALLGVGIALPAAVVVALVVVFRRSGWLTADGTVPAAKPADRPHLPRQEPILTRATPPDACTPETG